MTEAQQRAYIEDVTPGVDQSEHTSAVRVAQPVLDQMRKDLPPEQAAAVARLMSRVGTEVNGLPIRLDVPNGPPGAKYMVAAPEDNDQAPAIIYRATHNDEVGQWRVVGLMNRDEYQVYQEAETGSLMANPAVRSAVKAALVGVAAAMAAGALGGRGS